VFLPIGQQGGDTVTITPTSTTELLLLLLRLLRHGFFFNHKHKQKKATTTTTINNKRGTNPPLHKQKQTQQKNFSFFAKIARFPPTPNSQTNFFFLGGTISFAELQVLHQHNCIEIFWSNKHNQFLMFPIGKVL
jgi:hypothetical protein